MKLFEAFAGYGSQAMSLKRADKKFKHVGISEIDKYAIIAYDAVHGEGNPELLPHEEMKSWLLSRNIGVDYKTGKSTLKDREVEPLYVACQRIGNYGDISLITPALLPDMDLFTYSFPCQDISSAGRQAGLDKGTRSGLLWECEKIIREKKPKCLFMENVKNLVGKKFRASFDEWCTELESMGYTNKWKVVNAKKDGIPQNRERVFMISFLGESNFEFAPDEPLVKKLRDILEDDVDESYYLSDKQCSIIISESDEINNGVLLDRSCRGLDMKSGGFGTRQYQEFSPALTARDYKEPRMIAIGAAQRGREDGQKIEINKQEVSNSLTTVQKDSLLIEQVGCELRSDEGLRFFKDDSIGTLRTIKSCGDKGVLEKYSGYKNFRIRKLTPKECFRLMDVADEDFETIRAALIRVFYNGKDKANSQLYKMAGNSIVVRCMEKVWRWREYL